MAPQVNYLVNQSWRSSVLLYISQNLAANAGGSSCTYKWEISPNALIRKLAIPSLRSSVLTVVTELGAAQNPCHSTIGEAPIRCARSTHSRPKWQKNTRVSSFGFSTL